MSTNKEKAYITAGIANPEVARRILEIIDWYEAGGGGAGGSVTSVNGQQGVVVLNSDNISEGVTNKYYTDARAKAASVVNSTLGNETDRAASVAAMKAYVAANLPDLSDYYTSIQTDSLLTNKANQSALAQEISDRQTADGLLIPLSQKGANNGVATLDAGGKVPVEQLPNAVMTYEGTWNTDTNTPTLIDGTGNAGQVYIVSVDGTQDFGSGPIEFKAGDWVVYSGTTWQKSTSSANVVSVNGQQGIVVLDTDDLLEGVNKFYTSGRFDADLATKDTDDLLEGVLNFYFTPARAQAALASTISDINSDIAQEISDRQAADTTLQDNITNEVNARGIAVTGVQSNLDTHITSNSDAHSATAISNTPFGNLAATNVQGALNELQADIDTRALASALTTHIDAINNAHEASAIGYDPTDSGLSAINVQTAIDEIVNGFASKQSISEKGQSNGYASLDVSGRVPLSQLPQIIAARYVQSFNSTTDWTINGGLYEFLVLSSTHNTGITPVVQIFEEISGIYIKVNTSLEINSSGDITIQVTSTPDNRFTGKLTIL